jgi:hypothetical protein
MMKKSILGKLLVAGVVFASSMAAHAGASIYFHGECGSGAMGCEVFATLQQNGPSFTYSTTYDFDGGYAPVNFDLAYVGDTLVVTADVLNRKASEPYFGYNFAVYDASQPIITRCYSCGFPGSPEYLGNALAHIEVSQLPRDPAQPLIVNLPSLVPEADAIWLALIGLGVVGMARKKYLMPQGQLADQQRG